MLSEDGCVKEWKRRKEVKSYLYTYKFNFSAPDKKIPTADTYSKHHHTGFGNLP